jgi:hypothetical protein
MVNLRKDLSDLSESVGRQMKELKEMMSSLINISTLPSRGSSKRKKGKSSGTEHGSSSDETGYASILMLQNHGITCVNLMMITIESSAQREQLLLLPMTIVQRQSGRGLTCINESTRAFGWGISGTYPLTSSAGQLAKCPGQPPLLPEARVLLS